MKLESMMKNDKTKKSFEADLKESKLERYGTSLHQWSTSYMIALHQEIILK